MPSLRRYWPMWGMLLMMLGTWAAIGFDYYDRHRNLFQFSPQMAMPIRYTTYTREMVPLDGFDYSDCTFNEVTFLFNATGLTHFTHNDINLPFTIKSSNPAVLLTMATLKGLCGLSPWLKLEGVPHVKEPPECELMRKSWDASHLK